MVKRIMARGAWMGWGIAVCLGAVEAAAQGAPAAAAPKAAPVSASKPPLPKVTPEEKARREKIEQVEKVAKDFSAKRDSAYVNEARERDQKRREAEAEAMSRKGAPPDSISETKAPSNTETAR